MGGGYQYDFRVINTALYCVSKFLLIINGDGICKQINCDKVLRWDYFVFQQIHSQQSDKFKVWKDFECKCIKT